MVSSDYTSPISPNMIEARSRFSRQVILGIGHHLLGSGEGGVACLEITKRMSMLDEEEVADEDKRIFSSPTVTRTAQLLEDYGLAFRLPDRPAPLREDGHRAGRALTTYAASPRLPDFLARYNSHHQQVLAGALKISSDEVDRRAIDTYAGGHQIEDNAARASYETLAEAEGFHAETAAHLALMGLAAVYDLQRYMLKYPIAD